MREKRVVITGIGVVSPIGVGCDSFLEGLRAGRSGVDTIKSFDAQSFPVSVAGEIEERELDISSYLKSKKNLKILCRPALFGLAATRMAVDDSGLQEHDYDPTSVGVYFGACYGGDEWRDSLMSHLVSLPPSNDQSEEQSVTQLVGKAKIDPLEVLKCFPNLITCHVAIANNLQGPVNTFTTNALSGSQAVGEAYLVVKEGYADIMVCGGSEAPIRPQFLIDYGFGGIVPFSKNRRAGEKACKPFDAERDGIVLGEGAGVLILESLEHALSRSAHIYAEVCGYGLFFDTMHNGDGLIASMTRALEMSHTEPDAVDYINAEGNSTPLWDKKETLAVKHVFDTEAYKIPISSTKSMTGHLVSASGGVELIASVLAMQRNHCPPTINYERPDPECDLDYVPNTARETQIDTVLSNSVGWFGESASLLIKRFNG